MLSTSSRSFKINATLICVVTRPSRSVRRPLMKLIFVSFCSTASPVASSDSAVKNPLRMTSQLYPWLSNTVCACLCLTVPDWQWFQREYPISKSTHCFLCDSLARCCIRRLRQGLDKVRSHVLCNDQSCSQIKPLLAHSCNNAEYLPFSDRHYIVLIHRRNMPKATQADVAARLVL